MAQFLHLSDRLRTVAQYIPKNSFLADIGSDHAYLPVYCIQTGKIKQAVAGEVVKGPYESARATVCQYGLSDQIDVRLGDGLDVICGTAVDCISICGMGGQLIRDILVRGKAQMPNIRRLVLQPNVAAHLIREWAEKNQWRLIQEEILKEDRKIYEILVYDRETVPHSPLDTRDILFGPFLRKERSAVFLEKWTEEWRKLEKVKESLMHAPQTEVNLSRLADIRRKQIQIEGEIQ